MIEFKIDTKIKGLQFKVKQLKNPEKLVKELVFFGQNEMIKEAHKTVYSYKPKKSKRTGNTYRSVKARIENKYRAVVSPDSRNAGLSDRDYSIFIERGRKNKGYIPPRPFISNTFKSMKKHLKKIINNYVK